jgi:hypothetical protein
MKEEGCPDPVFEIECGSVTCILPAHPRHRIIEEHRNITDKILSTVLTQKKYETM